MRPVAFASRSLSETETHYAWIKKEVLAFNWACEKFSNYLIGMRFSIETDHKALIPLLGSKEIRLPPQVLRFQLHLSNFNYSINHVLGKLIYTADALSRDPLPRLEEAEVDLRGGAGWAMPTPKFLYEFSHIIFLALCKLSPTCTHMLVG